MNLHDDLAQVVGKTFVSRQFAATVVKIFQGNLEVDLDTPITVVFSHEVHFVKLYNLAII